MGLRWIYVYIYIYIINVLQGSTYCLFTRFIIFFRITVFNPMKQTSHLISHHFKWGDFFLETPNRSIKHLKITIITVHPAMQSPIASPIRIPSHSANSQKNQVNMAARHHWLGVDSPKSLGCDSLVALAWCGDNNWPVGVSAALAINHKPTSQGTNCW